MKSVLYVLLFVVMASIIFSCTKLVDEIAPPVPRDTGITVTIDSVFVQQFQNVSVYASHKGLDSGKVLARGFYWGYAPDSSMYKNVVSTMESPFEFVLHQVGPRKTIYCRAFVVTDTSKRSFTSYESKVEKITTGGLDLLWEKVHPVPELGYILQVLPGDRSFTLLLAMYRNGNMWPRFIKMDTSGQVLWDRTYFNGELKRPIQTVAVKDGYVTAVHYEISNGPKVAIFKTDLSGTLLWEQKVAGYENQHFVKLQRINDYVVKLTLETNTGYGPHPINPKMKDYWFGGDGQMLQQGSEVNISTLDQTSFDYRVGICPDSSYGVANDHFYYVPAGTTNMTEDVILYHFDKQNRLIWEQTYGDRHLDLSTDIAVHPNGNFSVLGFKSVDKKHHSTWLFQVDKAKGGLLWEYTYYNPKYGSAGITRPTSLFINKSGQHYVTGHLTRDGSYPISSTFILKVGSGGRHLWDYTVQHWSDYGGEYIYVNDAQEIYVFGIKRAYYETPAALTLFKWREL